MNIGSAGRGQDRIPLLSSQVSYNSRRVFTYFVYTTLTTERVSIKNYWESNS